MRNEFWILDTETTTDSTADNKASPFDARNVMVMLGLLRVSKQKMMLSPAQLGTEVQADFYMDSQVFLRTPGKFYPYHLAKHYVEYKRQEQAVKFGFSAPIKGVLQSSALNLDWSRCHTLVGHNIGFDLLWLLREGLVTEENLTEVRVWDTMLGTYLFTGQTCISPSLDRSAAEHDITRRKQEGPKYMWDVGYRTFDIPFPTLASYLIADLQVTAEVFIKQFREAAEGGNLKFFADQMEALFAHTMITHEGMVVNGDLVDRKREATAIKIQESNKRFQDALQSLVTGPAQQANLTAYEIPDIETFIAGRKTLSDLFYYEKVSVKVKKQVGTYKNGNPKYVTEMVDLKIPMGNMVPTPWHTVCERVLGVKADAHGNYPLSEKEIDKFLNGSDEFPVLKPMPVWRLLKQLLVYRKETKILNTYLEPVKRNLFGKAWNDGSIEWKIHPNFNMAITATGRLSSSKPNFHNQIDDPYKEVFVAPEGYKMVEIDFNQLEIMVLGIVSGDSNLCDLLRSGVDVHSYLYEQIHGHAPTKEERKPFKACSFGLIYGSSAKGLVETTGMDLNAVNTFMTTWFASFPHSQDYAAEIEDHISKHNTAVSRPGAMPTHVGQWRMPHGRLLTFKEYDETYDQYAYRSSNFNWRRPALKNYPIQALASDIVKYVITRLVRKKMIDPELKAVKIVNTVHDNGVFYVPEENLQYLIDKISGIMVDVNQWLKDRGYNTRGLKLKVEASTGNDWYNQTAVN